MEVFVSFLLRVYDRYSDPCCDYSLKLKTTMKSLKAFNGQVPFWLLSGYIQIKNSTNALCISIYSIAEQVHMGAFFFLVRGVTLTTDRNVNT